MRVIVFDKLSIFEVISIKSATTTSYFAVTATLSSVKNLVRLSSNDM